MSEQDPSIDWTAFAAHIQMELRRSNILIGELDNVIMLHRSTLSKAANGQKCSAETYIALCLWMGMRPNRFFRLGTVAPHFYLFEAPVGGPAPARDIPKSQLVPSPAGGGTKPRVESNQLTLPTTEMRGIRGKPAKMGGPSIDWTAFASTLQRRMDRFNITLRQLQSSSGVHYSTLSRVANGKQCVAVAYMTLCKWMMLEPTKFFRAGSP